MKQYVTVYDMIQKLATFPADKYIEFHVWVTHEQIKAYEKEWEKDDYVRFDAEEIDFKFDFDLNESKTAIDISMDATELEVKKE